MQKNNFLIPAIMFLTVFPVQASKYSNIKLSAINFGTGFMIGAAQAGINKVNNIEGDYSKGASVAATAGYAHIIRQVLVQQDPTLGKEAEQNQKFLSMVGQGLGQFVVEGLEIEKNNLGNDDLKFRFSVNISLLLPLIYRAACQSEVLYAQYGDRFWPKKN